MPVSTINTNRAVTFSGAVLQVVQTVKSDTFSTASSSFTDITGMSVSITPTSATSKILVLVDIGYGQDTAGNSSMVKLLRNSTTIYGGDTSAGRVNALNQQDGSSATFLQYSLLRLGAVFLDSPATTSSTTYKLQVKTTNGVNSFYLNRSSTDRATGDYDARTASSITVMEIAA